RAHHHVDAGAGGAGAVSRPRRPPPAHHSEVTVPEPSPLSTPAAGAPSPNAGAPPTGAGARPTDAGAPPTGAGTLGPTAGPPSTPWRGVAAGVALVLAAVLIGVVLDRGTQPETSPVGATVPPTGHTSTVQVVAEGMRYKPELITVPAGDRLVIELTNRDQRRHDLVLANGARTDTIGRGETVRLDAGVIGGTVEGW